MATSKRHTSVKPAVTSLTPAQPSPRGSKAPSAHVAHRPPVLYLGLAALALSALVLLAYANSLGNGFVWDDHEQILLNPALKPSTPWATLFTSDVRFAHPAAPGNPYLQNSDYRPLQMLTYRLLYTLFAADSTAFHVSSLLFAGAATLAAFAVFFLLTRRVAVAFSAAALFAVHPIHSEAVDWIAALPDLGFTLFFLLALALFLAARQSGQRRPLLLLSWLCFATALLWKETAVVFPLLLIAWVLLAPPPIPLRDRLRAVFVSLAPYCAILAAYLAVRLLVLGKLSAGTRTWGLDPLQFALNSLYLLWSYCAGLLLPYPLNAYHVFHPIQSLADPRALVAVFLSLVGFAILFFRIRGSSPPRPASPRTALFAVLWIAITLLPALDLNALGRNAFAERYLYLPSAGFCLLLTLAFAHLLNRLPSNLRKPIAAGALILALALFTLQTLARNPQWKDDPTLFAATLPYSPDAPFVHLMLASSPTPDATPSETEQHYLQAISLATRQTPADRVDAVTAYQGLAWLYADRSRFPDALHTLAQAQQIAPTDADGIAEQGLILARSGHGREAEPLLEHALATQPDNENVLSALGLIARDDLHAPDRAISFFTQALAVHSQEDDFAAAQHNNLGAVYGDRGDFPRAAEQFRLATKILPGDPEYHLNLATALAAQNRIPEARTEALLALRLDPNNPAPTQLLQQLSSVP